MRIVVLISILSAFLLSCEKEANIPIPNQDPKLAVSCFISPGDTAVDVFVYLSEPVFAVSDPNAGVLQNATVVLSNGIISITVPYNSFTDSYHANLAAFPIGYNTTYYLGVTDAQGRHASGKTTTPSASFPSFEASQTEDSLNSDNYVRYEVSCRISDIIGEENYYRTSCAMVSYSPSLMDTTIYSEGMSVFVSDRSGDGNTLNTTVEIYLQNQVDSSAYRARRVIVTKCNQDYYNFHSSVNNANFSNGNPFAEPTIIYSNMEGGYGCFGAYTLRYKDIEY